jgi:hypothetical protein
VEQLPFPEVIRLAVMAEDPENPLRIDMKEKKKRDFVQELINEGRLAERSDKAPPSDFRQEVSDREKVVEAIKAQEAAKRLGRVIEQRGGKVPLTVPRQSKR